MTKTIITHTAPDFDAIAYVWQMKKYAPGFEDAKVFFMSPNALDQPALDAADSVGDMAGQYDPLRWRFDHHQFQGATSTETCTARMVWLQLIGFGQDLEYLKPLIDEIHQGDLARTPAVGIHSLMRGWKIVAADEFNFKLSDYGIYSYGQAILSGIAADLKKKASDKLELDQVVIWKSDDGLIWAIKGGSVGTSFAAYDEGARVIIFEGKPITLADDTITYPVGASRAPEWQDPDLGELVSQIIDGSGDEPLRYELGRWYRHNAGFYAGRGGQKAADERPLHIGLKDLAWAFHTIWKR